MKLIQLSSLRWEKLYNRGESDFAAGLLKDIRNKFKTVSLAQLTADNLLFLYFSYTDLCSETDKPYADQLLPMDFLTMLIEDAARFSEKYDLTSWLSELSSKKFNQFPNPNPELILTTFGDEVSYELFPVLEGRSLSSQTKARGDNPEIYDDVYTLLVQENTDFPEFAPIFIQANSKAEAGEYIQSHLDQFLEILSAMSEAEDGSELTFDLMEEVGMFQPADVNDELMDKLQAIVNRYPPAELLEEFVSGKYEGPEVRWVHQAVVWHHASA